MKNEDIQWSGPEDETADAFGSIYQAYDILSGLGGVWYNISEQLLATLKLMNSYQEDLEELYP